MSEFVSVLSVVLGTAVGAITFVVVLAAGVEAAPETTGGAPQ